MQRPMKPALTAAAAVLALAACQGQPLQNLPGERGTLLGAAAGATAAQVLGDDTGTLETVLATVAGGLIGNQLLEKQNVEQALAQNQPVTLQTQGNERVRIQPVSTFQRNGQLCRQFTLSAEGAVPQQRTAVACQVGAGQWRLVQA